MSKQIAIFCVKLLMCKSMISSDIISAIPKVQQFLLGLPVKKAWLFGSCSRGEDTPSSDVDILVEYDRDNARITLMTISAIMIGLEDIFNRSVDLVESGMLLPFAEKTANNDKFLIYERKN